MGSEWFQTAFGAHYPLLYRHRDDEEALRCLDLLDRLLPAGLTGRDLGCGPVLDLGCGDGRHLQVLANRGVSALGLDLSSDLLGRARMRLGGESPGRCQPLIRGDMRRLPLADRSLGTVLSLFTAFGYFGEPAAHQPLVQEIARVLAAGGCWVLDYFDGDAVRQELADQPPSTRRRELGPLLVTETRQLVGRVVAKEVVLTPVAGREAESSALRIPSGGLRYREQVALFTLPELDALAMGAGLKRVAGAGGYDGRDLGMGDRWILVYQKSETPGREGNRR